MIKKNGADYDDQDSYGAKEDDENVGDKCFGLNSKKFHKKKKSN